MNSITCRYCQSKNVIGYGHIHNGKKRYMCHDCHRQFTPSAQKKYISKEQREMVDKMLLERISIAAISRVTGISKSWLYRYIKHVVAYTAESLDVEPQKC